MERLLARQLQKLGLTPQQPPAAPAWQQLLAAVDDSYRNGGRARYLLERSLSLSSREMQELNDSLRRISAGEIALERDRLESVIASVSDGLCVLDDAGRLVRANAAAALYLGRDAAELSGLPVLSLFRLHTPGEPPLPDDGTECLRMARLGAVYRDENALLIRDGGVHLPVSCVLSPIFEAGKAAGMVFLFRDVSVQRTAERSLIAAREKAEEASVTKTEFLATMSHEIRTPLYGVIGMTGLLLDTALDSEQREYAETARRSAETLMALINEILDFSKIERGRIQLEEAEFDPAELVEDVLDLFAVQAQEREVVLVFAPSPDLPHHIVGDSARIRQVLTNLVSNAVKFTSCGEVKVTVSLARMDKEGGLLALRVADTGIGIPAEALPRLFDTFTQADSSTTRRFGGTGLGLAISRRLTEAMGGAIDVQSQAGMGSVFEARVRVRWVPAAADDRRYPAIVPAPRLLVVHPSPSVRRQIADMAAAWGTSVADCPSPAESAVLQRQAAGEQRPFDVVLTASSLCSQGPPSTFDPATRAVLLTGAETPPEELRSVPRIHHPVRRASLYATLTCAAKGAAAAAEPPGAADCPLAGVRLLLAEDSPVSQRITRLMLERLGARVDVVADGREAVQAVRSLPYDLVLMDVAMPEMDGIQATQAIRAWERETERPALPILAMTAAALASDRRRCLAAGMDGHIGKPVTQEILSGELTSCLARRGLPVAVPAGEASRT